MGRSSVSKNDGDLSEALTEAAGTRRVMLAESPSKKYFQHLRN